jgi:superfamily I DNA/RNA helicase
VEIDPILDRHGIDTCDMSRTDFMNTVLKIMDSCKKDTNRIDFDDMIWFPFVHNLALNKYDYVFIDEAQDLNLAQIDLAVRSCAPGGRVISVGDQNQAIYGFRGADENAIQNIVDRCQSKRMPLSITYRCAKNIVNMAKELVPALEAAETAENGSIENIGESKMLDLVRPGDFILSRVNAPLIKWCLELLKMRVPANIQGRDFAKTLSSLVKKSKSNSIEGFLTWLMNWKEEEVKRLVAIARDTSIVEDKAECLIALCEGTASIKDLLDNIDKMFHDGDDKDRVILSSTHKAKGLERDRVFLLRDTYRPANGQEEANLLYVAITRARKSLFLVKK